MAGVRTQRRPAAAALISRGERFDRWVVADFLCLALIRRRPSETEARLLQILIGLLISNGPGSITALGAKGALLGWLPPVRTAIRAQAAAALAAYAKTGDS